MWFSPSPAEACFWIMPPPQEKGLGKGLEGGKVDQERAAVCMCCWRCSHLSAASSPGGLQVKITHLCSVLWKHIWLSTAPASFISNQIINKKHFPEYNTHAYTIAVPGLPVHNEKWMSIDYWGTLDKIILLSAK